MLRHQARPSWRSAGVKSVLVLGACRHGACQPVAPVQPLRKEYPLTRRPAMLEHYLATLPSPPTNRVWHRMPTFSRLADSVTIPEHLDGCGGGSWRGRQLDAPAGLELHARATAIAPLPLGLLQFRAAVAS